MIDALKEIVVLVEKLPNIAIWILAGLLFYKVVVIGSWFGIAKLLIERSYSYLKLKAEEPRAISLKHLLCQVSETRLTDVLKKARRHSEYLHGSDLNWLEDLIDKGRVDYDKKHADALRVFAQQVKPKQEPAEYE